MGINEAPICENLPQKRHCDGSATTACIKNPMAQNANEKLKNE